MFNIVWVYIIHQYKYFLFDYVCIILNDCVDYIDLKQRWQYKSFHRYCKYVLVYNNFQLYLTVKKLFIFVISFLCLIGSFWILNWTSWNNIKVILIKSI